MNKKKSKHSLTILGRSLALLLFEGLSLGMAVWLLRHNRVFLLKPYINTNQLTPFLRTSFLINMFSCGMVWVILGCLYSWLERSRWIARLYIISLRFSPLIISGFLPLIFFWKLWVDQELTFLCLVSAVGLSLPILIETSLKRTSKSFWNCLDFISEFLAAGRFTKALPLILVVSGVIGYTIFFGYFTIMAHHGLRTADYDMGIENNLMWNLTFKWLAGDPNTPLFKTTPFAGPNSSTLGWHTTYIAFLLTPFYFLYPHPETLLVLQSLIISATAIPLFLWARIYLNEWLAAFMGIAYLFFSPVHGSNLYDFHWLNLGPFFIMMMFYLLEARKDIWGAIFVLLTLAVREDVAPAVSIIGTYFLLSGRRPKLGLGIGILGAAYFVCIKLIFMPHIAGQSAFLDAFKGLLPSGETSFISVMKTVVANPGFTLTTLLERQKLIYLLHFLTPLVFIPFQTLWIVLFFIPGFFFVLLSTGYQPFIQPTFQYVSHLSPYLFIATILALYGFKEKNTSPHKTISKAFSLLVCLLACSQMFGAFFQREHVRGGFGFFQFGLSENDKIRYKSVSELVEKIPVIDKVAATKMLNAQVSSRADDYTIPIGIFDADWLLIEVPNINWERPGFKDLFQQQDFGVVEIRPPFALLKKHYDKSQNGKLLQMLGG